MSRTPEIAVVGSINMDLVVHCQKLPVPGETLIADSSSEICGGKGANQAVAAARSGGRVTMIGRVGDDAFAGRLTDNLIQENICHELVSTTRNCASGVAVVAVEQSGQNSILVVPGANGRVSAEDVAAARKAIQSADVLLLQLEVPIAAILTAMEIAREAGVRTILDPAPAPNSFPDNLLHVDLLCPNESEASALTGHPVESKEQIESAAQELHRRGAKNVAITLGERGTFLSDGRTTQFVNAFAVNVLDTTAAGDAFAGALSVFWSEDHSLVEAVCLANAAGALSASRMGAQPGMATRQEILKLADR